VPSLHLTHPDFHLPLRQEIERSLSQARLEEVPTLGWLSNHELSAQPWLAFAMQTLPQAQMTHAASINAWADAIIHAIAGVLPDEQPWQLHLAPSYGESPAAGQHRCQLIEKALAERLKKRRRHLLRSRQAAGTAFSATSSLVQCLLTSPEAGWLSVCLAPQPQQLPSLISPLISGWLPPAEDKAAPSRAFAKLVEAEQRLGCAIQPGESCVDLGASPGSWSYVALQRGAHLIALDRSPLRDDLMRHPRLQFITADAFKYRPPQPVDWLICDVIAAPDRSLSLLLDWLREGHMRRFIVTLKFQGSTDYPILEEAKRFLPAHCSRLHLQRLCANKNEVTAFGVRAG
jgi:23S rRNA (cytidine2498-2'-O)-methyltransferase